MLLWLNINRFLCFYLMNGSVDLHKTCGELRFGMVAFINDFLSFFAVNTVTTVQLPDVEYFTYTKVLEEMQLGDDVEES